MILISMHNTGINVKWQVGGIFALCRAAAGALTRGWLLNKWQGGGGII